jgi:hypothetical protein
MEIPAVSDIVAQAGISKSYASEIRAGVRRPSRPLAIHIFRVTGWRHQMLDGLTDEQIATLEAIEPWRPTEKAA